MPALAQQASPSLKVACDPILLHASTVLSFEQRACWYGFRLISPGTFARAAFSTGFGQLRGSPIVHEDGMNEFSRRFGAYYATKTARSTAELIAGYLHHEDPRPHQSGQSGVWNRTRSALLGVLMVKNADGENRPALLPIAGSFGAGMTASAFYGSSHSSMVNGLRYTGAAYGGYFGTAVLHEFQPDMMAIASRLLHRKKPDAGLP